MSTDTKKDRLRLIDTESDLFNALDYWMVTRPRAGTGEVWAAFYAIQSAADKDIISREQQVP